MIMNKKWYRWPEGYIDNYLPWYIIARRLLTLPTFIIGFVLCYMSIVIGHGFREGKRFREDLF